MQKYSCVLFSDVYIGCFIFIFVLQNLWLQYILDFQRIAISAVSVIMKVYLQSWIYLPARKTYKTNAKARKIKNYKNCSVMLFKVSVSISTHLRVLISSISVWSHFSLISALCCTVSNISSFSKPRFFSANFSHDLDVVRCCSSCVYPFERPIDQSTSHLAEDKTYTTTSRRRARFSLIQPVHSLRRART